MSNIETRPVGDVFADERGNVLMVVRGQGCSGCVYYLDWGGCNVGRLAGLCGCVVRPDQESVIFVKVKS